MDVQINTSRIVRKNLVVNAVRRNLRRAFGTFQEVVKKVQVSVTDDATDGSKLCCQLDIKLDGRVVIVVRQTNADSVEAVDRAFEKARKAIRGQLRRGQLGAFHASAQARSTGLRERHTPNRRAILSRRNADAMPLPEKSVTTANLAA